MSAYNKFQKIAQFNNARSLISLLGGVNLLNNNAYAMVSGGTVIICLISWLVTFTKNLYRRWVLP